MAHRDESIKATLSMSRNTPLIAVLDSYLFRLNSNISPDQPLPALHCPGTPSADRSKSPSPPLPDRRAMQ
jgi:hypothetical protein